MQKQLLWIRQKNFCGGLEFLRQCHDRLPRFRSTTYGYRHGEGAPQAAYPLLQASCFQAFQPTPVTDLPRYSVELHMTQEKQRICSPPTL